MVIFHEGLWWFNGINGIYPLVNCYITNWKDPPFYSWVNQLFRLGHFQVRKLFVYQRVPPISGNAHMNMIGFGPSPK